MLDQEVVIDQYLIRTFLLSLQQLEGATDDDENAIKVTPKWRGAEVIAS